MVAVTVGFEPIVEVLWQLCRCREAPNLAASAHPCAPLRTSANRYYCTKMHHGEKDQAPSLEARGSVSFDDFLLRRRGEDFPSPFRDCDTAWGDLPRVAAISVPRRPASDSKRSMVRGLGFARASEDRRC